MWGLLKGIYERLEKASSPKEIWDFFTEWILPFVLPVAAAVAGYLQHEPVMWIITAFSLCLMGAIVAYAAFLLLCEKSTPQNKLHFDVIYHQDLDRPQAPLSGNRQQRRSGQPARLLGLQELMPEINRKIERAQIGAEITNNAAFPISIILEAATTTIGGEMPPRSVFPRAPVIVEAWSKVRILDDAIDMDGIPCQRLSGQLDMTFRYGKPGRERFEQRPRGIIDVVMTEFGFVSQVALNFTDKTVNLQTALPPFQVRRS